MTLKEEDTLSNTAMAAEKRTCLSPIVFRYISIVVSPVQEVLNNVPLGKTSGDK